MRVAVIGIGVMGAAIASRLLATGTAVWVHNRSPEKCAPLVQQGARLAASPREATEAADFIITSLNGADILEEVVFGADGIAAAAIAVKLLVDMSSIDPARTARLAARLHAASGMGFVDAPLSGGAPAAARGALTLMLGGSDIDVAHAEPLLAQLSARRTHFGPPGSGQTVKLINQILCANAFIAVAEAVRFAEAHGVDATRIPGALAGGRADSRILQEFMARMARRDTTPTGRIANMVKDLEGVQRAALEKRIPLPVTSLVADLHRMLVAGGYGDADNAEVMHLFDLGAGRTR
jgi:2-hydroxy-3-oxopropionate reductase